MDCINVFYILKKKSSNVCLKSADISQNQKDISLLNCTSIRLCSWESQHPPDVPGQQTHVDALPWQIVQSHFSWHSSGWCGLRKEFSGVLLWPFLRVFHIAWALRQNKTLWIQWTLQNKILWIISKGPDFPKDCTNGGWKSSAVKQWLITATLIRNKQHPKEPEREAHLFANL